jgi:hypothetical protein
MYNLDPEEATNTEENPQIYEQPDSTEEPVKYQEEKKEEAPFETKPPTPGKGFDRGDLRNKLDKLIKEQNNAYLEGLDIVLEISMDLAIA